MAINHLAKMLDDAGAAAYWGRVFIQSGNTSSATSYIWQDLIHNRDYRSYEILKSEAECYWEPQWDNSTPSEIKNAAPWTKSLDLEPYSGSGASRNWRLIPMTGVTQDYGWNSSDLMALTTAASPMRERYGDLDQVDVTALPLTGSARPTTSVPGSFVVPSGKHLQANNDSASKIVTSFPFTLEAWVRPSNTNDDDMAGNSDGTASGDNGWTPHNIMMVACPNPESASGELAAGAPDSSWRHWGIGLSQDNTGVPVIHWGGWKTLSPNTGEAALHTAGPEPSRCYKPDLTGNAPNQWAQVVGIFHSRTEVQLFYNGIEVAYYKDTSFHEASTGTDVDFNSGGVDNRVPNIATFTGIQGTESFVQGATVWLGGVVWNTHPSSGSPTYHGNYDFEGRISAPALYKRALTSKEVADHYMTMTQESSMQVLGESLDFVADGGTPGTEKGLLEIQKSRIKGQRGCDELVIRDDTLTSVAGGKSLLYAQENPIQITDKGAGAIYGRYFKDPILPVSSTAEGGSDIYIKDNQLTNFDCTGYGIITALNVRREDNTGGSGSAVGADCTLLNLTGKAQYDQTSGSNKTGKLGGFRLDWDDTSGLYGTTKFIFYAMESSGGNNFNFAEGVNYPSWGARFPGERAKSQITAFSHDTTAGKIHLSTKQSLLDTSRNTTDDGRVDLNRSFNHWSLRLIAPSGTVRSNPITPWVASDHKWQIGPSSLIMAGDGKATQVITRKMSGAGSKLRTRFSSNNLRRHFNLSRMPAGMATKYARGTVI